MSTLTPPLQLSTLGTKPTWHNRAGRVDRSACFTLAASACWRPIRDDDWAYTFAARQSLRWARGKCDRWAELTFYARDLWTRHKAQPPYPLYDDFRSAKTNAMRQTARPTHQRGDRPCVQHMRRDPVLGQGPTNPNRGVGFRMHKMLGLSALWQSTLRIERIVQHAQLKQHFLVCPVCGADEQRAGGTTHAARPPRRCSAASKNRSPKFPTGRVTKLYLPLCTPREYEDALLVQLWLKTHTNPNRPRSAYEAQLIERYGELFEPRQLRCRQCLGVRYGEVK